MSQQPEDRQTFAEQDEDPRYQRYLRAKRTVDDRALSARVLDVLAEAMASPGEGQRLRLLEVACGTGAMFERLAGLGMLSAVDYLGVDRLAANIDQARQLQVPSGATARWLTADVFDLEARGHVNEPFDGLIACAFLDLFALEQVLPVLVSLVAPGGFLYFPINFDGLTRFLPTVDTPEFEQRVEDLYHRTMDDPSNAGRRSQTGRRLLTALPSVGLELIAADVGGWLVTPTGDGYPADEGFFLQFILDTVEAAIGGSGSVADAREQERLERFMAARRRQLQRAELVYQTHQIDVFCRRLS
jgi:2-polyprenyl-3-methyl-5-hydroxy-6-metoxy-1,4-benzoquinol methylase